MIDQSIEINELHENIFLNNDLLFIGHRKGEFHKFNSDLWIDSFYDYKYDIFVGVPKKIGIKKLIKLEQKNYISSYILVFNKLKISDIKDFYYENIEPAEGVLGLILQYKFEQLKRYNIIAIVMMGENEEWIRYIEI